MNNMILTNQDLDDIINKINNSKSLDEKKDLIFHFCNNPYFINSLYYIDQYDEEYQSKINKLSEFFQRFRPSYSRKYYDVKGLFRVTLEELANRLRLIKMANKVVNSNESDFMKAYNLASLFKDAETLRASYSGMVRHIDHPNIQIARYALNNFDKIYNKYLEYENNGLMEKTRYYLSTISYYQNYEYAKFVIEKYIEDEDSYKGYEFISELGLDKDAFVFCLKTIEELDPDLYKKFREKRKYNKKVVCFKNVQTLKELSYGIQNGIMKDGTEFDLLEFIKRVPFKKEENFIESLYYFMNNTNLHESKTILSYVYKNGLQNKKALAPINKKQIYECRNFLNGVQITNDISDIVIDYLTVNQIPVVNKTYDIAVRKYLNGEINKEMVKQKKKEMEENKPQSIILIPKTNKR